MIFKHNLFCTIAPIAFFLVANCDAANKTATVLAFPAVSVGSIQIERANVEANKNTIVSKVEARGKVTVPDGCAIDLQINYNGGQDTRFLLSLPPDAVLKFRGRNLELTDKEISNISHLSKIILLDLEGTEMTDASSKPLSGLKELRDLNIGDTMITANGLPFIIGLKKLESLRLSRNKLGNAAGPYLSQLTSVKTLDLCGTSLNDSVLACLSSLSKLESLNIRRNNITDQGFTNIAKLKNLRQLNVTDTRVTIKGLRLLSELPKLNQVTLRTGSFKPEELASLKKSLPRVNFINGSREGEFPPTLFDQLH
ncbi:hypothetical protein BH10CYA1_BH10CYA1_53210 [soil metagenome]